MPRPAKEHKYVSLGNHLKNEIRNKYRDLKAFSKECGIPVQTLNTYETGRSFPPIDKFIMICKALDRTPSFMLAPLLDLRPKDEEFLNIFAQLKDFYQDSDAWKIIQTIFLGLDIYNIEKSRNVEKDIIDILQSVRDRLLRKKL